MKLVLFLLTIIFSLNSFAFDHEHSLLTKVLKQHTKKVGSQVSINYTAIKKHPEELQSYLEGLRSVSKEEFKKFTKDQQLAFWINAYNGFTIELIIRKYPVKSIKDIGSFFSSAWSIKFITLFGKEMSLDDIEHKNIRKKFKEPRIHFAVNCASFSCPSLYQEAFTANQIDAQLNDAAQNFILNTKKNYYNKKEKTLYLSKIFKWYGADFNANYKGHLNYIRKFIKAPENAAVEWIDYDWSLNEIK